MALKYGISSLKYYIKPKNNCTYFIIVNTGYLFKLHTLESLMNITLGVTLKPRNIALLYKNLHFLSLQ